MAYTITEAAKRIGVSRATLYRRLPEFLNDLGDNLQEVDGVKTINEAGIEHLRSVLVIPFQTEGDSFSDSIDTVSNKVSNEYYEREIERLRSTVETKDQMIEILKDQIQRQEDEIKRIHERMIDRDRQADQFQQLINNFQVMLTRPQLEDPEHKEERKRRKWFGLF